MFIIDIPNTQHICTQLHSYSQWHWNQSVASRQNWCSICHLCLQNKTLQSHLRRAKLLTRCCCWLPNPQWAFWRSSPKVSPGCDCHSCNFPMLMCLPRSNLSCNRLRTIPNVPGSDNTILMSCTTKQQGTSNWEVPSKFQDYKNWDLKYYKNRQKSLRRKFC